MKKNEFITWVEKQLLAPLVGYVNSRVSYEKPISGKTEKDEETENIKNDAEGFGCYCFDHTSEKFGAFVDYKYTLKTKGFRNLQLTQKQVAIAIIAITTIRSKLYDKPFAVDVKDIKVKVIESIKDMVNKIPKFVAETLKKDAERDVKQEIFEELRAVFEYGARRCDENNSAPKDEHDLFSEISGMINSTSVALFQREVFQSNSKNLFDDGIKIIDAKMHELFPETIPTKTSLSTDCYHK